MIGALPAFARALPYIASGLLVAALWWLWEDRADKAAEIARLGRELSVQAEVLAQKAESVRVLNAHLDRMEAQNAETQTILEEISGIEGGDAPLSLYLRTVLGRMR